MRDIARAASVSLGSVSNDFNNPDLVAEDTRSAIRPAIQQAGCHPNDGAGSLKTNQALRLGLMPLISVENNYSLDPGDTTLSGINTTATCHFAGGQAPAHGRGEGQVGGRFNGLVDGLGVGLGELGDQANREQEGRRQEGHGILEIVVFGPALCFCLRLSNGRFFFLADGDMIIGYRKSFSLGLARVAAAVGKHRAAVRMYILRS
jgi:hypothetical protein